MPWREGEQDTTLKDSGRLVIVVWPREAVHDNQLPVSLNTLSIKESILIVLTDERAVRPKTTLCYSARDCFSSVEIIISTQVLFKHF